MKKLQATVAAAVSSFASTALAAGDSGTSSVGDLQMTGAEFGMLVGGLIGLGVVIWLVVKVVNK